MTRTANHPIHRKALCRGRGAIYALATNPGEIRCTTEDQLDAWWRSLPAEDKSAIYEQQLGDAAESCRFCGCTENRACVTNGVPCSWLDPHHTVCSAPSCAEAYRSLLLGDVFHGGEQLVVTACNGSFDFFLNNPDFAAQLVDAAGRHMVIDGLRPIISEEAADAAL